MNRIVNILKNKNANLIHQSSTVNHLRGIHQTTPSMMFLYGRHEYHNTLSYEETLDYAFGVKKFQPKINVNINDIKVFDTEMIDKEKWTPRIPKPERWWLS